MESIFIKAAEQVPNLAVLSLIVYLFLKFLKDQNAKNDARTAEQAAILANLNRQNFEESLLARSVIAENTRAATANTNALREMSSAMKELTLKVK